MYKNRLQNSNNSEYVEWFWENETELMKINFGISYNSGMNTFQPDFIVKFKNGKVGIFDTKPINYNVPDTTVKAEALHKYLTEINHNRGTLPKVIGGIVVQKGTAFYYRDEAKYVDFAKDNTEWNLFSTIFNQVKLDMEAQEYFDKHRD